VRAPVRTVAREPAIELRGSVAAPGLKSRVVKLARLPGSFAATRAS
jgi:hypothetical protein